MSNEIQFPPWLPADSKTLYQQGLEALTTEDSLRNANPAHWLPAYCAHALHDFAEEHLSVLANPDTLASFSTEVVDPLLRSETSKAQEFLQGLLSTADTGYKTVLRLTDALLTMTTSSVSISLAKIHSPLHWRGLPQNCRTCHVSRRLCANPPKLRRPGCARQL